MFISGTRECDKACIIRIPGVLVHLYLYDNKLLHAKSYKQRLIVHSRISEIDTTTTREKRREEKRGTLNKPRYKITLMQQTCLTAIQNAKKVRKRHSFTCYRQQHVVGYDHFHRCSLRCSLKSKFREILCK